MCTCGAFLNPQSPRLRICLSSAETTEKTKGKGSCRMSSPLEALSFPPAAALVCLLGLVSMAQGGWYCRGPLKMSPMLCRFLLWPDPNARLPACPRPLPLPGLPDAWRFLSPVLGAGHSDPRSSPLE